MKLVFSLLILGVSTMAHPLPNLEVVMRGGDVIGALDEGDFPTYHADGCTVRFPRNGNWATQNGYYTGGFDANQNSQCNGYDGTPMTYSLQRDGNFVAYCGYNLDYATHTGGGFPGEYFLAIDNDCILHLYKGSFNCSSVHVQDELWTNIHLGPIKNGDRLGKGEIVRDLEKGTQLVMQSR
jgi:hypothetical protein